MKKLMLLIVAAALSFGVFAEGLEGIYSVSEISTLNGNASVPATRKMVIERNETGYKLSVFVLDESEPILVYIVNETVENSNEIIFSSEIFQDPFMSTKIIDGKFNISTEEISFTAFGIINGTPSDNTKLTYTGEKQKGIIESDIKRTNVGEIVTISPTLSPGYEIESLVVRYGDFDICLNDKYQFIKPAGDVEISATYRKIDGNDDEENPNPDNGENGNGNQNPTDVNEVNVSAQSIVGEKFHTILGQPLSEPQTSGVTVVTRTYSDGAVRSSKEVR